MTAQLVEVSPLQGVVAQDHSLSLCDVSAGSRRARRPEGETTRLSESTPGRWTVDPRCRCYVDRGEGGDGQRIEAINRPPAAGTSPARRSAQSPLASPRLRLLLLLLLLLLVPLSIHTCGIMHASISPRYRPPIGVPGRSPKAPPQLLRNVRIETVARRRAWYIPQAKWVAGSPSAGCGCFSGRVPVVRQQRIK